MIRKASICYADARFSVLAAPNCLIACSLLHVAELGFRFVIVMISYIHGQMQRTMVLHEAPELETQGCSGD
jgi:hypothetical protein